MSEARAEHAAARTAAHMRAAVASIDATFGVGYAAQNPTLVSAFMLSATAETAILSGDATVDRLDRRMEGTTERLCTAMENLRPRIFG